METPAGEFKTPAIGSVIFGAGSLRQVGTKAEEAGAKRALIVTVKSLISTDLVERVKSALGSRCAGVFSGVVQHVPRQCIAEGARAAREASADLLVSLRRQQRFRRGQGNKPGAQRGGKIRRLFRPGGQTWCRYAGFR